MIKATHCINASQWQQEPFGPFILYASDNKILEFLKRELKQAETVYGIDFKNFYQAFACLIINPTTLDCYLVRDHFGLEPFYYTVLPSESNRLCFGSNLPDVLTHIKNPQQDEEQIYSLLTSICTNDSQYTDQTLYSNVVRVTPGHIIHLRMYPNVVKQRYAYWQLNQGGAKLHYASDEEYDAHFATLLQEAVQVSCEEHPSSIALEYSGGLDSSGILAALNKQKIAAELFMHVGENKDERIYGEQVVKELETPYSLHYVQAEDFDLVAVLDQCKHWFAGAAPYLFYMLANNVHQAVRHNGQKVLLSGFGGDECVTSHASLRAHSVGTGYKTIWKEIIALQSTKPKLWRVLQTLLLAHPQLAYVIKYLQSFPSQLAHKQTKVRYKPYYSHQEREYDYLQGPLSHHVRMRIEYSAVIAKHMGFSYQYPLLYPPLLEFCFALPPEQKRRQGQNRLLMRRYLAKQVPSGLFNTHKKCGDIAPGTYPKCQELYDRGELKEVFNDLPYAPIFQYIIKNKLITQDRHFHIDLLRYMLK